MTMGGIAGAAGYQLQQGGAILTLNSDGSISITVPTGKLLQLVTSLTGISQAQGPNLQWQAGIGGGLNVLLAANNQMVIASGAAALATLLVQAVAAQTADLQQWTTSGQVALGRSTRR